MNNEVVLSLKEFVTARPGKNGRVSVSKILGDKRTRARRIRKVPALEYAYRKWRVLPLFGIREGGGCRCGNPHCKSPGKHPLTMHGVHDASYDTETVLGWWKRCPEANVGIQTGKDSGLVVLDIDPRNGGLESLAELEANNATLSHACKVETGGGGFHLYFKYPFGGEYKFRAILAPGIDIKADGGYIVAPPSLHASGKRYSWLSKGPMPEIPAWLLERMVVVSPEVEKNLSNDQCYREGERNNRLTSSAGSMRAMGFVPEAIEANLLAENRLKCLPPLPEEEVKAIAAGIVRYAPGFMHKGKFMPEKLARHLLSDFPIHATPIDEHGKGVNLLIYNNGVFTRSESRLRSLIAEKLGAHGTSQRILEVLELLRELSKRPQSDFDSAASSLINLKNGMLQWATGKLLPHDMLYRSTTQFGTEFKPEVRSELLDRFLSDIFPKDAIPLVEEMLGYFLIPSTKYQKAFVLYGVGGNGKSTFLKMLRSFVGERLISSVSLQDLCDNRFRAAQLLGKTLNIYSDLPSRKLMSTDLFKSIVSGDSISVEHKYGMPFEFSPHARLLFATNQLPDTDDTTDAFFRRILVIPTPNRFDGAKADVALEEKLRSPEVKSALLNRAVAGLRRLERQGGFSMPESVVKAIREFRIQSDPIAEFAGSYLAPADSKTQVSKSKVYQRYQRFCFRIGAAPATQRRFDGRIAELFKVQPTRRMSAEHRKERLWVGLELRDEPKD